jgi:GTPase SAR1 family protein
MIGIYAHSIVLKLMVIGDGGVGKSCFISRFVVSFSLKLI